MFPGSYVPWVLWESTHEPYFLGLEKLLQTIKTICSVRHRRTEVGISLYWRTHSRMQNRPEWLKRQSMRGETRTKQITQTE